MALPPELLHDHLNGYYGKLYTTEYAVPNTVRPVFKTTWEIGTAWELRTPTSGPLPIQYIEMDLRNKTTSEFRTVFHSPLGVPNSQVSL